MGYIGAQPATNFETVRKQVSTTNSGTTITLDFAVSSVQDILVTVNAVVQSYDNYSVSGTTLTLGGTLNNDRVEILYVGRTFQTVTPAVGTVTNDMLVNSSITLNGSAVSLGGSASVDNTPSFAVRLSSSQSIATATYTLIQFNTEDFDTDSAYDTSNYRFVVPNNKEGKYFFSARLYMEYGNNANEIGRLGIYKNGTAQAFFGGLANGTENQGKSLSVNTILDLAVSDYVDVRMYHQQGGNQDAENDSDFTYFYGYKLI
jgi:hypothetical protein